MSKIFSMYVLKDIALAFLMAFSAFTLILFAGNSVRLIAEQVPLARFIRVIPYLLVFISTYTMPMSLLTAAVFTFGRLGLDNELTAIRAAGISLSVVILPVLLLALALCLISLPLNTHVAPRCHFMIESVIQADLWDSDVQWTDRHEPTISLPDCKVFIGDGSGDVYRDILICTMTDGRPEQFIIADTATLSINREERTLDFLLRDGTLFYAEKGISNDVHPGTFGSMTFVASLPSAQDVEPGMRGLELGALREKIKQKAFAAWRLDKAKTEMHKRISLSFACMALVLVGLPLGILTRRGNFTAAFGVSIAIVFVLYYPMLVMGEVLGNMGLVSPATAMWTPNAAAACIGTCLLWRTRKG